MQIENLKLPVWLINKDKSFAEYISKYIYLQTSSSLSIKKKSLENCYILDDDLNLYEINSVKIIGNLNKPWKFEFFNPMKLIHIDFSLINDKELLENILIIVKREKNELEIRINSEIKDIL